MYKLIKPYLVLIIFILNQSTYGQRFDSTYISEKYSVIAQKIIETAMSDSSGYLRLGYMCDTFGPRLSGSDGLNKAILWIYDEMKKDGLDNVKLDDVMVPHWVRGNEHCELIKPRKTKMEILALGGSICTPPDGITARAIVVADTNELIKRSEEVKGKIVVFDEIFENYGQAVTYRVHGADVAARYGAMAAMIRAVTPIAQYNPHTGVMAYDDSTKEIPSFSLTPEDAMMLHRMEHRGQEIIIHVYSEAKTLPESPSYNVMGELKGTDKPDEIISAGGHIDSWDVGTGANDDGAPSVTVWEAVKLLKKLGLKPKRTIRDVMWVNEENGTHGGKDYAKKHKNEKHFMALEHDSGCFPVMGLGVTARDSIQFKQIKSFEPLLKKLFNIEISNGGGGVDIGPMMRDNKTPGIGVHTNSDGKYFWYHHSNSDTFDKIQLSVFQRTVASLALTLYIISDLP